MLPLAQRSTLSPLSPEGDTANNQLIHASMCLFTHMEKHMLARQSHGRHFSITLVFAVIAVPMLGACGGGGDSPPPPAAPVWSSWTSPGTQPLLRGESSFEFIQDGSENLLAVERRPAGSSNLVMRRYTVGAGWDAGVAVDAAGKVCTTAKFAYRDGHLVEAGNGYLYYDKATGWCNVPSLPAADGPATALKITPAADRSVIGARIVGQPSATSKLETFELSGSSWVLKSTLNVGPVQPINSTGFQLGAWSNATAHSFKDGVLAWAQYEMLPLAGCPPQPGASCALLESVELAGDTGANVAGQRAPCPVGTGCFNWRVLPDGTLIGYDGRATSAVRYYRRENKAWVPTVNGESGAPGLNDVKLDPVFVHSPQSAVFTSGCAAGQGFCEGREFVRYVKPDGSSRAAQVDGLSGILAPNGDLALLRTTGGWQIAYRRALREYSEPSALAPETFTPTSLLGGNLQQYIVWQANNAAGQIEISISSRSFK